MVSAQGFDELAVLLFVAVLGEHAKVGKTLVKGLGSLVEATGKSVVDKRVLEHLKRSEGGKREGGRGGGRW